MSESNAKPPMVISYLRFSTKAQAKGGSYERQMRQAEDWAKRRGVEIDESLSDLGVSAFRGKNSDTGALGSLLKLIEARQIPQGSVLLIENLDRLSRNELPKAQELFLGIVNRGVTIVALADGEREYSRKNLDLGSMMMSLVVMARSHEESQTKSFRNAADWQKRRERARECGKPLGNICPSWLQHDGEGYRVKPKAAAAVRRAFELALDGLGCMRIAQRLREEHEPITRSGEWRVVYVKALLHDRRVLGEYQPYKLDFSGDRKTKLADGEPIASYYPSVIDDKTFYAVQASMSRRKLTGGRGDSYGNLFQGVATINGTPIRLRSCAQKTNGKGKAYRNYRYYVPASGIEGKAAQNPFPVESLDWGFLVACPEIFAAIHERRSAANTVDAATAKLAELDERIAAANEAAVASGVDMMALVGLLGRLQEARQQAAEAVETAKREAADGDGLPDAMSLFSHSFAALAGTIPPDGRMRIREAVRRYMSSIEIEVESLTNNRQRPHKRAKLIATRRDGAKMAVTIEHEAKSNGVFVSSSVNGALVQRVKTGDSMVDLAEAFRSAAAGVKRKAREIAA